MTTSSKNRSAASSEPTLDVQDTTTSTGETTAPVEKPTTGDQAATPPLDTTSTAPADAPVAADPDKVKVKLAHPLDRDEDLRYLGLEPTREIDGDTVKGYRVGEEITVNRSGAVSLINAGYALGVEPENKAAVDAVLNAGA